MTEMNRVLEWEEEIRKRCVEQNIDIDGCSLLFSIGGSCFFSGERITGLSESKDGRWVCIPVHDEEAEEQCGEYIYRPQCFEVRSILSTYLNTGSMIKLSTIWCLEAT